MSLFRRKRPNLEHTTKRWKELQQHCRTRKTWPLAINEGDNLLNDVLKSTGYKGKTTGERLVAAQRVLTDNEAVWFSHKFCTKIEGVDVRKLKKQEVITALAGFRQALKDLGAME